MKTLSVKVFAKTKVGFIAVKPRPEVIAVVTRKLVFLVVATEL